VSDFIEAPYEPDLPETSARPPRLVALHPVEDPPRRKGKAAAPPCSGPCEACGTQVLTGATRAGTKLMLELGVPCYVVQWTSGTPLPTLAVSMAYPVHRCLPHEKGPL
jgi:hypothetical protein